MNKNYIIHDDLNNSNRKRIDLLNGAILADIKELRPYSIQIQEQWTEGETVKMYVILTATEEEIKANNKTMELEKQLENITGHEVYQVDNDFYINITGSNHTIYICIDSEGYNLSTKHNYIEPGLYDEEYRNQVTRKSAKAVINYIEKYL